MPRLNRKGPEGTGPMTGRGMGRCNPANRGMENDEILQQRLRETPRQADTPAGTAERGVGRGLGRGSGEGGRGLGRGLGRGSGEGGRGRQGGGRGI